MKNFIEFLKNALCSDSPVSSKRLSGFIGWVTCLGCVIYCVIKKEESPEIVNLLFLTSTMLLGLDSIINIFKK